VKILDAGFIQNQICVIVFYCKKDLLLSGHRISENSGFESGESLLFCFLTDFIFFFSIDPQKRVFLMKKSSCFVICVLLFSFFQTIGPDLSVAQDSTESIAKRTEWFKNRQYGVFVHYLASLQNNKEALNSLGRETSWDECVREFDVEKFADQIEQTGAGYVIFTMMQQTQFLIAPNETFDRLTGYRPGEACATRDLVEDLYQALHKRNIDLMLYWTGDGPTADLQAGTGMKVGFPVTREFVQNWANVAAEYGRRYGDKVKGYWVDGCYEWIGYTDEELFRILAEGLRAGNPDRILAFNPGVDPKIHSRTIHEDYTCGEMNSFLEIPKERFVDGKQWHILSFMGTDPASPCAWGRPGVALDRNELADYVFSVNSRGGVVSIDMMLYRDGSLDRSQLENIRTLRDKLAERERIGFAAREGWSVPAGNIAWKKFAQLTSLDGTRQLIPSCGKVHDASRGVDGDRGTSAIGAGDWAWRYCVDFNGTFNVNRVVVHFGSGYPTDVEVFLKKSDGDWTSIGHFTDQKGESLDISLEPLAATHIAVSAYKPDAENQPGVQMSISELEVYEKIPENQK